MYRNLWFNETKNVIALRIIGELQNESDNFSIFS
jgi:hypothetical protein